MKVNLFLAMKNIKCIYKNKNNFSRYFDNVFIVPNIYIYAKIIPG